MAHIRIVPALDRARDELRAAYKQLKQYSGIEASKAMEVDNIATEICDLASDIAGLARQVQGDRSAKNLNRDVRKALGFTSP